jgi:plastocyanin domain-containing protein
MATSNSEYVDVQSNTAGNRAALLFVTICVVVIAGLVAGFAVFLNNSKMNQPSEQEAVATTITSNISEESSQQIVAVSAKGSFSPKLSVAKANKETVLRVSTKNTFDCSSALVIPSLNVQKSLPVNGNTDITIPPQKPGTKIAGTCSMGMYNFSISFIE